MKLYNYLTEALNNPYKYYLVDKNGYDAKYRFTTDTGRQYAVTARTYEPTSIHNIYKKFKNIDMGVEFLFVIENYKVAYSLTGTGDAFRVFATIKQIIKDYLNKNNVETFSFSSSAFESSREKLYDRFAKEIDKTTKYKFIGKESMFLSSYYHFVREDLLQ